MNCDADSGVSVPAGRGRGRGRGGGIAVLPEVSRGLLLRYNRGIRNMKEKEKEKEEVEEENGEERYCQAFGFILEIKCLILLFSRLDYV